MRVKGQSFKVSYGGGDVYKRAPVGRVRIVSSS